MPLYIRKRYHIGPGLASARTRRAWDIPADEPAVATFSWGCASCGERWGPPHEAAIRAYLDVLKREHFPS
jgi:hypothetical protein